MKNIKKIFAIQGFTSSGKDTITSRASKELNIPILISHTSRPARENEVDGISYYFVDNDYFENNDFLEERIYNTEYGVWRYGLSCNELIGKPYSLFIVDRQGYEELQDKLGKDKLVSIFIKVEESELIKRQELRGDCKKEFARRLEDDKKRFENYKSDYIVHNNELDLAIEYVKNIILSEIVKLEVKHDSK